MAQQKSRSFKDISFSFDRHPKTKDILIKNNEQAIVSAVKHLILTNKGERPFQPSLGTDINRLLFENIDVGIASRLSEEIESLIKSYEPRVELDSVTVTPDYDNNGFSAEINFYIIGIPYLQSVDMFLESTR
jgi:uncharacterized protein